MPRNITRFIFLPIQKLYLHPTKLLGLLGTLILCSWFSITSADAAPIATEASSSAQPLAQSTTTDSVASNAISPIDRISTFHQNNLPNPLPLTEEEVAHFGRLLVQTPQGRIEPIDTYASELLRKLYHRDHYQQLDGICWLIHLLADPVRWVHEPLLELGNKSLRAELLQANGRQSTNHSNKHIALADLFTDQGAYIPAQRVETAYAKPAKIRNKRDKELIKLDEKVNILYGLITGHMLAIFPSTALPLPSSTDTLSRTTAHTERNSTAPDSPLDSQPGIATARLRWYSTGDDLHGLPASDSAFIVTALRNYLTALSDTNRMAAEQRIGLLHTLEQYQQSHAAGTLPSLAQINAEIFYNHADIFRTAFRGYLILGFLLLVAIFCRPQLQRNKLLFVHLPRLLIALILLLFLWQSIGLGLRWYISGRAPWTNAYESMVYVGWITVLAGLLFARRSTLTLALATLMGGVVLFVSNLNWLDPQITPLVPVLKSYWLMIHVSVITASYGFFGIGAITGLAALIAIILGRPQRELRIIGELTLLIGLVLLAAGIFLGAIWANESWGRYWGWDPKETWALITLLVYAFITHSHHIPRLNNDYAFAAMSLTAIASVLMTFFGVNYYLSGLHAYGGSGEISLAPVIIGIVLIGGIILWAGIRYRKERKPKA